MTAPDQDAGELDQLERLVDIQRQIVDLAEQNAAMERHCLALRAALAEDFERRQQRMGAVWLKFRRLLAIRGFGSGNQPAAQSRIVNLKS